MKKMYISDKIKENDIRSWTEGTNIMITAPTGSGKSTIIMGNKSEGVYGLNDFALEQGKSILFLTNRDLLKGQFKEIIKKNGSSNIRLMNYQAIEKLLLDKVDMQLLNEYDYIVIDECHYFFNDSTFNDKTDLSLKWILEQNDKTRIFMSATSNSIVEYLEKYAELDLIKYSIDRDYSYIDKLYFYEDDEVLKKMLLELPKDEKAIYFSGAEKSYNISQELEGASFYCSEHNRTYSQYRDMEVYEQIKNNYKFDGKILCTTTVMDNGVSILDDAVKHIIIDVFDIDSLIQCLGRKRLSYGEKVNVYIKNYTGSQINGKINHTKNGLLFADTLIERGENYLVAKYPRKSYGKIIYEELDGTIEDGKVHKYVNFIMYYKYNSIIKFCEELLTNKRTNEQYSMYISNLLQINYDNTQMLESYFDAVTIENIIDAKFTDKKLFLHQEYVELNDMILKQLISIKGTVDYRTKKINPQTLENILRVQLNLPYAISKPKQESRGENRGKRYVIITKIN
ncbi:DEAD/DEAH box helicase family protein [Tissierella praeacuta]|uniref:DEAD/DEAH box helicase family protein n=1 Tax=Tissierella praeacuta TaxID=43131 RepID=UPI00351195DB